jgi:Zn-dependent M28 family amino/carboxypeptidase
MTKRLLLFPALFALACATEPAKPLTLAQMPDINTDRVLTDIKKLSSDEFEGRAPGSKGEELTVAYLTDQLKAIGLEPGNPNGTWIQKASMVGITPKAAGAFTVKKGAQKKDFNINKDVVVFSRRVTNEVKLDNSDLIFAGYGVQAPEFQWDDFKGVDVKGKTIVVLVNDPQVPMAGSADPKELDPSVFGGKRMTYYGRWTYKYEKAAELGAAACIIVHETEYAGYPFNVVQGFGGERFDLVTPDKNMNRAKIESWMSLEAATRLFKAAGLDYQALKAQAATRAFKPVPLGMTASFALKQKMRTIDSQNVIGKIEGSDPALKNEYVVFSAHWDHLGIGPAKPGDPKKDMIYNGASDNASGTAAMLEIARQLKRISPAPKRTLLFIAVTAEEQGLLGSQYYAQNPLYPLDKTLADINVDDNLPMWGRTKDEIVIGLGASDLDDYLRDAAAEQGRTLTPDGEPEKGLYYRSDHFNFAKVGVPALDTDDGVDYIGKPPGFGKAKKDDYTANDYHSPSDEVKPDWDMSGFAEEAKLLMAVGYRIAQAEKFPEWKPGNEFKAVRDRSIKK